MFVPLLVGSALAGAATVGSLVQHYRRQLGPMTLADVRALRNTPVSHIAIASNGFVKIVGTLGSDFPIESSVGEAPLAVREIHHYSIEGRGPSAVRVRTRVERSTQVFYVDDDSGRVLIHPNDARIDYEVDVGDPEPMIDEQRLRIGERVCVLGVIERTRSLASHPLRGAASEGASTIRFVAPPLITWRTEPEVFPKLTPPLGATAMSASSVALAVLGAILQV
jgi:hypothetical protein